MKFFKNTLAVVALLALNSASARYDKSTPVAKKPVASKPVARKNTATQQPIVQPVAAGKTYAQLVTMVKNSAPANVWNNGMISNPFVQSIMAEALASNLDSQQFDALLQTARDFHAKFENDQRKDRAILQALETQRKDAVEAFEIRQNMQDKEALNGAL